MLTGMKVKVCLQLYRGIFDMHVLPVLIANTDVCKSNHTGKTCYSTMINEKIVIKSTWQFNT